MANRGRATATDGGRGATRARPRKGAGKERAASEANGGEPELRSGDGAPGAELISATEDELKCRLLVYHSSVTSLEKWDLRPLYGLLEAMGRQKKAALVIQSPGGSADAAHALSSLLHDYIDDLQIYVVTYAASAATILALAANRLLMGPGAELSPVDPQVPIDPRMLIPTADSRNGASTNEPAYVPAHVIRDFLELTGVMDTLDSSYPRPKIHPERLEGLFEPLNPWILGWYERADKVSRLYARRALVSHLLRTANGKAEPAELERLADEIIHVLLDEHASHEAGIQRKEARQIGLPIVDCPDKTWGKLQELQDWYDDVLARQNVGRIMETTDGVHVLPARPERACGHCHEVHQVDADFHYCPTCGCPFNILCRQCGRPLRAGWRYCPKCAEPLPEDEGKPDSALRSGASSAPEQPS